MFGQDVVDKAPPELVPLLDTIAARGDFGQDAAPRMSAALDLLGNDQRINNLQGLADRSVQAGKAWNDKLTQTQADALSLRQTVSQLKAVDAVQAADLTPATKNLVQTVTQTGMPPDITNAVLRQSARKAAATGYTESADSI